LTVSRELATYFESTVNETGGNAKLVANWVMGDFSAALNHDNLDVGKAPVTPAMLAGMLKRILDNTISGKIAKDVFETMWQGEGVADEIIEKKGLKQITDTGALESIIDEVIAANPQQLEQYRAGKDKLLSFFVGQVMQKTKGKANPGQVNELLRKKLVG
ncbi:MAG: Asp-tRNA(Asn)/Glu-tRNA(Gln) amidotransferase GatCAB subunit B, partial [Gammaproteobacteria bacterium]